MSKLMVVERHLPLNAVKVKGGAKGDSTASLVDKNKISNKTGASR